MLIHTKGTDQSTEERTIQYKFSSCSRLHNYASFSETPLEFYEFLRGRSWSLIQQVLEDGGPEERVVGYYELTALFLAAAFAQELELSHGWPEGKTIAPVCAFEPRVWAPASWRLGTTMSIFLAIQPIYTIQVLYRCYKVLQKRKQKRSRTEKYRS